MSTPETTTPANPEPPGSFAELVSDMMRDNQHPYWVRRSKGYYAWQVCCHSSREVVDPQIAVEFHDWVDAKEAAFALTLSLLQRRATHG